MCFSIIYTIEPSLKTQDNLKKSTLFKRKFIGQTGFLTYFLYFFLLVGKTKCQAFCKLQTFTNFRNFFSFFSKETFVFGILASFLFIFSSAKSFVLQSKALNFNSSSAGFELSLFLRRFSMASSFCCPH